jgi:hypothetical protein
VGDWRAKRQHLAIPMDRDGSWLAGCILISPTVSGRVQ